MHVHGRVVVYALGFATFALAVSQGCSNTPSSSTASAHGTGTGGTGASAGTGGAGAGGAGVGGGGASGAGGSCTPFSEPPGTTCQPTLQCKSTTMVCNCSATGASCYEAGKQNGVHPPNAPPPEGGCCDTEGLVCGYETCGPICRCTKGAWTCQTPGVCPPLQCPPDPSVLDGQHCEQFLGQVCGVCNLDVSCSCELQLTGAALWQCVTIPC